jgi:hypothetical protein
VQALGPKPALQPALRRLKPSLEARDNPPKKEGCNPVLGHNSPQRRREYPKQERRRHQMLSNLRLGT